MSAPERAEIAVPDENVEREEQTQYEKDLDLPAHELNEQADVISTDAAG